MASTNTGGLSAEETEQLVQGMDLEQDIHEGASASSDCVDEPQPKRPKVVKRSPDYIFKQGTVHVRDLLQTTRLGTINSTLVAAVTGLSPAMMDDALVYKYRQRVILTDHTGSIQAYVHRRSGEHLLATIGDVVSCKGFKITNRRLDISTPSALLRAQHFDLNVEALRQALDEIKKPLVPYMSVDRVLNKSTAINTQVSFQGEIAFTRGKVEILKDKNKPMGPNQIKQDIGVEDALSDKVVLVTLWNCAALHEISEGLKVSIMDSRVVWNEYEKVRAVYVDYSDNIIVPPPRPETHPMTISAVEHHKHKPGFLVVNMKCNKKSKSRIVHRDIYVETLDQAYKDVDLQVLQSILPITGVASLLGNEIKSMTVTEITENLTEYDICLSAVLNLDDSAGSA